MTSEGLKPGDEILYRSGGKGNAETLTIHSIEDENYARVRYPLNAHGEPALVFLGFADKKETA